MNQITPLSGGVPQHIANKPRRNVSANATSLGGAGNAILSLKGKVWSVRYQGETTMLRASLGTDPRGRPLPVGPVPTLDVVIVGIGSGTGKTYYAEGYEEGAQNAPDCFSVNGVAPDPASPVKQNATCRGCPQDAFGSRINQSTGKGGKACSDHKRVALVPAGNEENESYGGPMLLRVPYTSTKNLTAYRQKLERLGADISEVITRLSFNPNAAYPLVEFNEVDWLSPEAEAVVETHTGSSQVYDMLEVEALEVTATLEQVAPVQTTLGPRPARTQTAAPPVAPPAVEADEEEEAVAEPVAPVRASPFSQRANGAANPQPAAQPAPQPAPVQAQAAAKPAPKAQPRVSPVKTTQVQPAPADLDEQVDDLLSDIT